MKEDHTEAHEELIQAVVTGEVPATATVVKARREACDTCRDLLDQLPVTIERLVEEAREEEALLAAARGIEHAPGEDRIEAVLRGAEPNALSPSQPARPARPSPRRLAWIAAALAAVAIGIVAFRPRGGDGGDGGTGPPITMGGTMGGGFVLASPLGEVEDFDEFSWSYDELSPGGWYLLEVFADDAERTLLREEDRIRGETWRPDPDLAASWPRAVRWRVTAFDASGAGLGSSPEAAARRSP